MTPRLMLLASLFLIVVGKGLANMAVSTAVLTQSDVMNMSGSCVHYVVSQPFFWSSLVKGLANIAVP